MRKITVLLADDHNILRQGLRSLLARYSHLEVLGESENGRQVVEQAGLLKPDLVIMDVAMPDLNGIEATHQILAAVPEVRVLGLSMHSDRQFVSRMFEAGASGYLLKDCASEELVSAINKVMAGENYLGKGVMDVVLQDYVHRLTSPDTREGTNLTSREREVLQLMAEGLSSKAIASRLGIGIKTVEAHRKQIREKLDIHSVAQLTKYAVREGITTLEL